MVAPRTWMHSILATFVALAVWLAPLAIPNAHADNISEARSHYQKGNDLFARGDYQAAIAEFAAADSLASSPMLEFNIALCYDRLGDNAEALRRYRVYLRASPQATNRATVEAKIRRIEGQLRQESEERQAAAVAPPAEAVPPGPAVDSDPAVDPGQPAEAPEPAEGPQAAEVYTPGAGETVECDRASSEPTDPELRRVAAIDVAAIRDQQRAGQYGNPVGPDPNATAPPAGYPPPAGAAPPVDKPPKASKPIYKQWWFWVVAGVGVIILVDFATDDSSSENNRRLFEPQGQPTAPSPGGLEWRF